MAIAPTSRTLENEHVVLRPTELGDAEGDLQPEVDRIEIGWTAYGRQWQRTAVNPATKLLLLGHAFEDLGYVRVSLKTDGRNDQSQGAIRRLGAVYEGTLRSWSVRPDGSRRDTVYFSILRDEWRAVRRHE